MPRFAANLSTMFPEFNVADRFRVAADAGFQAVEFLRPYDWPIEEFSSWLAEAGLEFVLFNTPGRLKTDLELGAGILPGREGEFREIINLALQIIKSLGGSMVHVTSGSVPDCMSSATCEQTFIDNMSVAATAAAAQDVTLLLEPLNRRDHPGYLHSSTAETRRLIELIGAPNVKLQYDFYHLQISQGDHRQHLVSNLDVIGHIQFSSVPGRHEPQYGELNMALLFDYLDEIGYDGWVGAEYTPKGATLDGLAWGRPYGIKHTNYT